ncbi:uncharacterized protein LOC134809435 isoform X2 [Pan troglodytes]|uniref:uncharacterized protein LOC134809435 isoform X2 n=1 Tax=Pan troglodytes TaxID=9598 RepID=UPI0030135963
MAVSAFRSFLLLCEEGACFFFAFCHDCHVNRTPGTVQGPPVWPHAVTLSKGVTTEVHGKAERCDVLEDAGGKHAQRTGAITRLRAAAENLAWATIVSSVEVPQCEDNNDEDLYGWVQF